MFLFGKKQRNEVEEKLKTLDKIHSRNVEKIEKATDLVDSVNKAIIGRVDIRHVTEAIANATGALKR